MSRSALACFPPPLAPPPTWTPSRHLPHLGADASVAPGPHHHQLIWLPGGGERGLFSQAHCPASPSPLGPSFSTHLPPPGEGLDSPLSGAPGSWVGLLRQGGARGTRAKAQRGLAGAMKKDSKKQTHRQGSIHRQKHSEALQTWNHRESRLRVKHRLHLLTNICGVHMLNPACFRGRAEQRSKTLQELETTRWGKSANQGGK